MKNRLVLSTSDREALEILKSVFFTQYSEEDFLEKMKNDLTHNSYAIISSSEITRAAEFFSIRQENEMIGILMLKYYKWEILGPQVFFKVHFEQKSAKAFSLSKFKNLIDASNATHAAELAYFWVNPIHRGKGIGKELFEFTIKRFQDLLKPQDVIFTLAQGNRAHLQIGKELRTIMLEHEREINGTDKQNGLVHIKGELLPISTVEEHLGFPASEINSTDGAIATRILAIKHGIPFRGYSSNLSLLFATTIEALL